MEKLVSLRKFAELVGVSDTAVRKAIANGYIIKGVIGLGTKRPKINVDVASEEWGKPVIAVNDPSPEPAAVVVKMVKSPKLKSVKPIAAPKPVKVSPVDDEDDDFDIDQEDEDGDDPQIPGSVTMVEAKRQAAVLQAEKLRIQVAVMNGELVNKEEVYRKLFDKGQTVRSAIMSIPDRIVANLLACKSVTEANNLLTDELMQALEKLSVTETNEEN